MILAITVLVVFILIITSELLWRRRDIDTEYTRKFVHVSVGSFVAFWPLFLRKEEIILLSAAFVIVVVISNYFNLFRAIHSVQRPTWGELFFASSVGILAFVADQNWIYSVALLHMSLADGMAAIVGMKFGKSSRYNVFGYAKSVVGTLTFFVVSMIILIVFSLITPGIFSFWLIGIAVVATVIENLAVRGFDNILVPLLVASALNLVH